MLLADHDAAASHPSNACHHPLSHRVVIESLVMTVMLAAAILALFFFVGSGEREGHQDDFFTYGIDSTVDPFQKQAEAFKTSFGTSSGGEVTLFSDTAYSVSAKVESVTAYDDTMGDFMTYDLLLAWGILAEEDVDAKLSWEQADRRGTVSGSLSASGGDIDADYVISHVSNSHVIAANHSIAAAFATIRAGDVVRIDGRLVDIKMVEGNQVYNISSSKSRTDQGDGACEVILVDRIRINDHTWS